MLLSRLLKFFVGIIVIGGLTLFVVIYSSSGSENTGSVQVINNVRFYSDHLYQYLSNGKDGKIDVLVKSPSQDIVNKETFRQHNNDNVNGTRIVKEDKQKTVAIFKEPSAVKKETAPAVLQGKDSTLPLCSERGENLGIVFYLSSSVFHNICSNLQI